MTNIEFLAALKQLGWSQRKFAIRYCLDKSTVNRWATGSAPVSPWVERALRDVKQLRGLEHVVSPLRV